jgi:hypothetical protein
MVLSGPRIQGPTIDPLYGNPRAGCMPAGLDRGLLMHVFKINNIKINIETIRETGAKQFCNILNL